MSVRCGVIPTPQAPAKLLAAEVIKARFTDIISYWVMCMQFCAVMSVRCGVRIRLRLL